MRFRPALVRGPVLRPPWFGQRPFASAGKGPTPRDEVRWLCEMDGGEAAFCLLMLFRSEHAGRMVRNESRKYRAARDVLLRTGLLILVKPPTNGARLNTGLRRVP